MFTQSGLTIIHISLYVVNLSPISYWNVCFDAASCTRTHRHTNTPWNCVWRGLSQWQPVGPGDQGWTASAAFQPAESSEPRLWATTWWKAGGWPWWRQGVTPPPKQRVTRLANIITIEFHTKSACGVDFVFILPPLICRSACSRKRQPPRLSSSKHRLGDSSTHRQSLNGTGRTPTYLVRPDDRFIFQSVGCQ